MSYEVGPSKIHGKGVLATKNIKAGDIIGTPLSVKYFVYIDITSDLGIWLNHSWCPNAKIMKREKEHVWDLIALQDIKKGSEINMDYRDTPWFISKPMIWYN